MPDISRRHLASVGLAMPVVLLASAVAGQQPKPEIKRSVVKPIIVDYVNKLSEASKRTIGVEYSAEEKAQMVDSIFAMMEAQNIYAFVDP